MVSETAEYNMAEDVGKAARGLLRYRKARDKLFGDLDRFAIHAILYVHESEISIQGVMKLRNEVGVNLSSDRISRILEELETEGYVARAIGADGYRPTEKTEDLFRGHLLTREQLPSKS